MKVSGGPPPFSSMILKGPEERSALGLVDSGRAPEKKRLIVTFPEFKKKKKKTDQKKKKRTKKIKWVRLIGF